MKPIEAFNIAKNALLNNSTFQRNLDVVLQGIKDRATQGYLTYTHIEDSYTLELLVALRSMGYTVSRSKISSAEFTVDFSAVDFLTLQ